MKPFDVTYVEGADVGYRWYARTGAQPLFPFGYGLSYSHFDYNGLKVSSRRKLTVTFTVGASGGRAGVDTPQVYVTAPGKTPRLVGWRRLRLRPNETRQVTLVVDPRLISNFDTALERWRAPAGLYRVEVAASAADIRLAATINLAAVARRP